MTATATPQSGFVFTCGLDGRGGCAPLEAARSHWYHLDYSQPDAALREQSDRIARYVEDLDLVRERAVVLHEDLLNRIAEQQNARMYLLAIVTAIFLPITFITGLFGMNVAGLPGTEDSRAFEIVVLVMLASLFAVVVLMKRRRWL